MDEEKKAARAAMMDFLSKLGASEASATKSIDEFEKVVTNTVEKFLDEASTIESIGTSAFVALTKRGYKPILSTGGEPMLMSPHFPIALKFSTAVALELDVWFRASVTKKAGL